MLQLIFYHNIYPWLCIRIFADILANYLGVHKELGAYLTIKPLVVLLVEEIFQLMTGQYHILIQSLVSKKSLSEFSRMLQLIFCHNIYPWLHHMESTGPQAQQMIMVA